MSCWSGSCHPPTNLYVFNPDSFLVLWCLAHNIAIAGGLEMQRRYGQWDREGYVRGNP